MLNSSPQFTYDRAYLATVGMEAIYEFQVNDMPVAVAVSSDCASVHTTGPKEWAARIGEIAVTMA